jgi:protein TonB
MDIRPALLVLTLVLSASALADPEETIVPPGHRTRPDPDLRPIHRVEPVMPREALIKGISGWVRVAGTLKTDGTTTDLRIVAQDESGLFGQASLDAVAKWRFAPFTKGGKPVEGPFEQRLEYRLSIER